MQRENKTQIKIKRIKTIPKESKVIGYILENKDSYFFKLNLGVKNEN